MGNLKKTDLIIALIFGCVISLLCFQLKSSKKGHRGSHKKETQQLALSSQHHSQSRGNNLAFNSGYSSRVSASAENSLTYSEEESEYNNPENDLVAEQERAQIDREMSILMDRKLEKYLFHQIGLPSKEITRVLSAKRFMEDEITKNNQGIINPTDELSAEMNNLNQQILSNYQEELKQILGPENYQRYSQWQNEQDAAIAESYAGGKQISMDDI